MKKIDTGTQELLCHVEHRVGLITLNKPDKKNALGDILTPALRQALLTLENDPDVGCIMITGSGNAFCAGGDIGGMGNKPPGEKNDKTVTQPTSAQERIADLTTKQLTLTARIHNLSKVTIAALPGAAAGAGFSIALACDLRVASSDAFVTTAFRNIGLSGDYGGSWFLSRLVGLAKAKELYFTADRVYADEAKALGIVNQIYPAANFTQDALEFAKKIAYGPGQALARMKMNINTGLACTLEESLALEAKHTIECFAGTEAPEAITAFMNKRQPDFFSKESGES